MVEEGNTHMPPDAKRTSQDIYDYICLKVQEESIRVNGEWVDAPEALRVNSTRRSEAVPSEVEFCEKCRIEYQE